MDLNVCIPAKEPLFSGYNQEDVVCADTFYDAKQIILQFTSKKKDNIVTVSLSPDILAYDDRLFPLSEIIKNEKAWVSHVDELDIDSGL